MRRPAPRWRPALALAATALAASACGGGGTAPTPTPTPEDDTSPLAGQQLYNDPAGDVPFALEAARTEGREDDVEVLEELLHPTATWLAGQHDEVAAAARRVVEEAAAEGTVPVLVLYNVPGRDCDLYSRGGAADAEEYLAWVGGVAHGLGDSEAVVVLEPDAIAHAVSTCPERVEPADRYAVLSDAVDILAEQTAARVYLDAGNSSWDLDQGELQEALRASGVERAAGFSLNVSNFETTEDSAAYGQELAAALGGARFVIDTSRNGAGPPPPDLGGERWCNPRTARLGQVPTTDPGIAGVDALLWVKQPGASDGDCGRGEPDAGVFWPEYAQLLVS